MGGKFVVCNCNREYMLYIFHRKEDDDNDLVQKIFRQDQLGKLGKFNHVFKKYDILNVQIERSIQMWFK